MPLSVETYEIRQHCLLPAVIAENIPRHQSHGGSDEAGSVGAPEREAVDSFGTLMLRADVTVSYETRCARCLDPVSREFSFHMERMVLTGRETEREFSHLTEDGEWDGVTDDILYVNEGYVDADADIVEEAALAVPTFDLCEPDCPGLCPKCGRKLRDGGCGCREEKYINPQFAVLQTLLDKKKED